MFKPRVQSTAFLALLGLVLGACAHSPVVTPVRPTAAAYPSTRPDEVRFYGSEAIIPFEYAVIATIEPRRTLKELDDSELRPFRALAAKRGANGLAIDRTLDGVLRFLAVRVSETPRQIAHTPVSAAQDSGNAATGSTSRGGCVGSCDVHVRGYTRRDGTYVRPHTRSRPGGGRGRRH